MKKIILALLLTAFTTLYGYCANVVIEAKKQTIKMDQNKGFFSGDVQVSVGDIKVKSPRAELDLDPVSKKPSLATFFDNPYAFQNKENKKHEIKADIIKVSLIKKSVLAQGNSQSIMMENRQPIMTINADSQEYDTNTKLMKADGSVVIHYQDLETFSNKASAIVDKSGNIQNLKLIGNVVMKEKANVIKGNMFEYVPQREEFQVSGNTSSDVTFEDGTRVYVEARYQQFNKLTSALVAGGNVKVKYKDYYAQGPKAQLFVDPKTNKPDTIIFTGRSKITNEGSTVEADKIRMTLNPKAFFADGNVKTSISQDGNMEIMP
ncbi:TPA: hypothetical protein IAA68_03205 [Candidatus Galligastranaerophilus faecipullorum]|nr:hypothetical protein [Candidatus Galligastranaerophilus faecipullorum]